MAVSAIDDSSTQALVYVHGQGNTRCTNGIGNGNLELCQAQQRWQQGWGLHHSYDSDWQYARMAALVP